MFYYKQITMHMNYSQIMSPPVPLCLKKWGVMTHSAPMGAPPLSEDSATHNNTMKATTELV